MLPDGVTGFGSILDASWIGSIALITGALPAEFGMRTVGLVDITTRADIFNNSGTVGVYGGSQGTITPTIPIRRHVRQHLSDALRRLPERAPCQAPTALPASNISSPAATCKPMRASKIRLPSYSPIHDFSQQEKGFAYMSTFVDPDTRLSLIAGNLQQRVPDSQHARPAGRLCWQSAGARARSALPTSIRRSSTRTSTEFTQYAVLAAAEIA